MKRIGRPVQQPYRVQGKRGTRWQRSWRLGLLFSCALWLSVASAAWLPFLPFAPAIAATAVSQLPATAGLADQARDRYAAGEYAAAAQLFDQAAAQTANPLQQAALWANASLAYQQVGDWAAAETRLQQARQLAFPLPEETPETLAIAAQIQDIEAQLRLSQGQATTAAEIWEVAAIAYEQSGNLPKAWQTQLSQAQALQSAGFYVRSIELLEGLIGTLETQPPSEVTLRAYRSLGEALRLTGKLTEAEGYLHQSLQLAQQLGLVDEESLTYRKLGDLARLQTASRDESRTADTRSPSDTALNYYEQAAIAAASPLVKFQAELGKLRLWTETQQWPLAYEQSLRLWETQTQLPPGRVTLYSQIELIKHLQTVRQAIATTLSDANPVPDLKWYAFIQETFGRDLNTLRQGTTSALSRSLAEAPLWYVIDKRFVPLSALATQLLDLRQVAQDLGDVQAEATLLGVLASFYEQVEDLATATQLTQEALVLAQSNNLGQVAYGLQAQLGRIKLAQGDREGAIKAYEASVQTLQTLREDVVSVSSEAQYSFNQSIEPIYRELATLLLAQETAADSPENLKQAREVIELLQLAELDNFFREACLSGQAIDIDAIDNRAAVFYPILLPDGLNVVVSLPNQVFKNFYTPVDLETLNQTVSTLQDALGSEPRSGDGPLGIRGVGVEPVDGTARASDPQAQVLSLAAQLYDWLIRPAEDALAEGNVQTIIFVLDGSLRNIPMSVLYDGQQYLIEKYAIALTPGLRLVEPQPLAKEGLSVLLVGLSEESQWTEVTFAPLANVLTEVDTIKQYFPSTVVLNNDFNVENFTNQVGSLPKPIVHLATHGKFGSTLEETFVLAWDDALRADRFSDILLASELSRGNPIELLVLSACETAKGDSLAALGLAGIAIRSGARSTLASLWQVDDAATATLMGEFYKQLTEPSTSKAEAVRQAQLAFINQKDSKLRYPYFWAPFVLLGNWL